MSFTYDVDSAVRHLKRKDRDLAKVIKQVGPFTLRRQRSGLFRALARAITSQQLSTRAAATIHQRLVDLCHERGGISPRVVLSFSSQQLRDAGLSWAKVAALQDLADKVIKKALPSGQKMVHMANEDIINRLIEVIGIGRWSAEMFLIFTLGRPDVLPVTDLGIRKGFQIIYQLSDLPALDQVQEQGQVWSPYRSVASWYLWRATDSLPV